MHTKNEKYTQKIYFKNTHWIQSFFIITGGLYRNGNFDVSKLSPRLQNKS